MKTRSGRAFWWDRIRIPAFLFLAALSSAGTLTVPSLPPATFADTEVTTNVAVSVWTDTLRHVQVSLTCDTTPSNNVQVAFGTDESNDGNLSAEETGLILGWDCGEWFITSAAVTNRFIAPPADPAIRKTLSFHMRLGEDGVPRSLQVTDGSSPIVFTGQDFEPPPPWLFSKTWNLLKITARGVDVHDGHVSLKFNTDPVILLLR